MKSRTLIQILLGVAAIGLAIWLYLSITEPVKFDNEFNKRREACATKLKGIRSLEEAYKNTYGHYTASFDTLVTRLMTEDSMKVVNKNINYDKIPEDVDINEMTEADQLKNGYVSRVIEYVNPIQYLRENKKLNLTDEEIKNLRYVPYPRDKKYDFELEAGYVSKGEYSLPVFECKVMMEDLLQDLDKQLVINKIDELIKSHKYPGWKVGDMTQAVTDGNFE